MTSPDSLPSIYMRKIAWKKMNVSICIYSIHVARKSVGNCASSIPMENGTKTIHSVKLIHLNGKPGTVLTILNNKMSFCYVEFALRAKVNWLKGYMSDNDVIPIDQQNDRPGKAPSCLIHSHPVHTLHNLDRPMALESATMGNYLFPLYCQ